MNLFNLRRSAAAAVVEPKCAPVTVADAPQLSRERLMPSTERAPQMFVRGQGSWLWDSEGHAYLDFTQGGAVNSLGHSPSVLVKALGSQAQALINPGSGYRSRALLALVAARALAQAATRPTCSTAAPKPAKGRSSWRVNGASCTATAPITSSPPARPAMAAAWARCRPPTHCRAIVASRACRVSARCRSMTWRRCMQQWIRAPWRSCLNRSRARQGLFRPRRRT